MSKPSESDCSYHTGIGVMTGTSLDGVDLCLCRFTGDEFQVLDFECISFPAELKKSLNSAQTLSALEYFQLEKGYSEFLATCIQDIHQRTGNIAQFLGVHGQTIFHEPGKEFTTQMLNGGLISAKTGLVTVCDFRRGDVALGGQGAPLVPIGDRLLFSDYTACMNLGGFANISYESAGQRLAYDICPVNYVLDRLANKIGQPYDDQGKLAESGEVHNTTLEKLNDLPYYSAPLPKSLGREWVEDNIDQLLESLSSIDALRTMTEHISEQIANALPTHGKILVTGGGAYNSFLVSLIEQKYANSTLTIPERHLLEGKEALIFALLAKLRLEGKTNVLNSVTGARKSSCSGAVFLP